MMTPILYWRASLQLEGALTHPPHVACHHVLQALASLLDASNLQEQVATTSMLQTSIAQDRTALRSSSLRAHPLQQTDIPDDESDDNAGSRARSQVSVQSFSCLCLVKHLTNQPGCGGACQASAGSPPWASVEANLPKASATGHVVEVALPITPVFHTTCMRC